MRNNPSPRIMILDPGVIDFDDEFRRASGGLA